MADTATDTAVNTAVILAAGEGTRMRPLTHTRPKVMLPIANRPILEHVIEEAKEADITRLVIVVGYKADMIREYFGDGSRFGVDIEYVEQHEQLGTAHAIDTAINHVDRRFLALNGDILLEPGCLEELLNVDGDAVMTVKKVARPEEFGVIETQGDRVRRIREKPDDPKPSLANSGIYVFEPGVFDYIGRTKRSPRGEYEITDTLQMMIDDGLDVRYHVVDRWLDIGRPWDLLTGNEMILEDLVGESYGDVEPGVTIRGEVCIGAGTQIRSGAYIEGPTIIGEACDIGPNCYIRGRTAIGDNVRIGHAVEIKNSIIMNCTRIGHLSYVGDSVVGEDCNFGAGTVVANLRHDNRTIRLMVKGELEDSGRRKLGVIMGDQVKTGINTTINVGTVVEDEVLVAPGRYLRGHVSKD